MSIPTATARFSLLLRVGKIVRAPCPRGSSTSDDFAHPCMGTVKRERRSGSKLLVPHAPIEGVDQGPMSVISFLGIVSLFDLGPFLRPDPRVSPRRRAQLQSRLAVAVS